MSLQWYKKNYKRSVTEGRDEIVVSKSPESEWIHLEMIVNDESNGKMTIRSREMIEHLHFILGQMLTENIAININGESPTKESWEVFIKELNERCKD